MRSRSRRLPRCALVAGLALSCGGCVDVVEVVISGSLSGGVALAMNPPDASCIDDLIVEEGYGTSQAVVVWHVRASGKCVDVSSLRYGARIEGMATVVAAQPLRTAVTYDVSVSGPGVLGGGQFQIVADTVEQLS